MPKGEKNGRFVDFKGEKIGLVSVVKRAKDIPILNGVNAGKHKLAWECRCDCGNVYIASSEVLAKAKRYYKDRYSCGCKRRLPDGEASFNKLFYKYISEAKDRGYSFNLDVDYFRELTSQNCYYCNLPPSCQFNMYTKTTKDYTYNGIDRVENDKGYEIDNCVPCCKKCNRAKSIYTKDDFLNWVESVYQYSIKNKNNKYE